jgi:squalene-hopene/tetraprenyl-beta-curcumene cyclase
MLDSSQAAALREDQPDGQGSRRLRAVVAPTGSGAGLQDRLAAAVAAAQDHLLSLQRADGHWCAELEGDSILQSEYAMLLLFFGRNQDPKLDALCAYLRRQQGEHGGWSILPDGPPEVSPSVKAYFVLKVAGDDPDSPHMARARETILRLGGLEACNSFTKLYLSIFGAWAWRDAPAVPPELILLPKWFYLNIYEMSSWSRAIVVPLSVIWALKPHRDVGARLDELRSGRPMEKLGVDLRERLWYGFFRGVNRCLHMAEALSLFRPVRRRALERCEAWFVERFDRSGGLAAIFPSIANAAMALRCLGYPEDHPGIQSQLAELEKLEIADEGALRLQPCFSPVWDTALAINALLDTGVSSAHPAMQSAASWLLDHEVRSPGDWQVKCPDAEPGGWYFEYSNEFYPDCDDTAEVLAALGRLELLDANEEARRRGAVARAVSWQASMQSRDGGWGAFDKDCDREVFTYVPFADHNAMIDPSTSDVSARTIEALLLCGLDLESTPVRRGLAFLERQQEHDGAWYGRWGANYIYGTWLALCALGAASRGSGAAARRGAEWLLGHQNDDGGWGETLLSYDDPRLRGSGESTAAQTGWAMLGLAAVVDAMPREVAARIDASLARAAAHLLDTQKPDGSWEDRQWTGTGFPRVFYLRYHYYDRYFPLQALAAYGRRLGLESRDPLLREIPT